MERQKALERLDAKRKSLISCFIYIVSYAFHINSNNDSYIMFMPLQFPTALSRRNDIQPSGFATY